MCVQTDTGTGVCISHFQSKTLHSSLLPLLLSIRFAWAITINYAGSTLAGSLQERLAARGRGNKRTDFCFN